MHKKLFPFIYLFFVSLKFPEPQKNPVRAGCQSDLRILDEIYSIENTAAAANYYEYN